MEFRIEENIYMVIGKDKIPLSVILLDFLNCSIPEIISKKDSKSRTVEKVWLWNLVTYDFVKPVYEYEIVYFKNNEKIVENLIGYESAFNYLNAEYEDNIRDISIKTVPASIDKKNNFIQSCIMDTQKDIISLINTIFIKKELNRIVFDRINVNNIGYRIIYSLKNKSFEERYEINDIYTFCIFSIVKLLQNGTNIKNCENCGDYFVPKTMNEIYCDKVHSNGRTCKLMGYENKLKNDNQIMYEYRKAYKNHNAIMNRSKHTGPKAEERWQSWKIKAKNKLKECQKGHITLDEFKEWLKKTKEE